MKNILIIGSAPSAMQVFIYAHNISKHYDEIYCINNAWWTLKYISKNWCHSTDFKYFGTLFPTDEDKTYIKEEIVQFIDTPYWYNYENKLGSGTIFLSVLYHIVNLFINQEINIHAIGCDFDYSNKKQTHFYGEGKVSEEVLKLLKENTPEYSNIAADPFRYGINFLKEELNKTLNIPNIYLKTLSDNPNQLLPYEKINLKDL